MRWRLRGFVVAAALYAAAAAYAGGSEAVRLTLDTPRVEIGVAAAPETTPSVVQVRIGAIDNPSLTPFGIIVRLAADGRELGRLAVFPADRTGDYFLSVKPEEQAGLSGSAAGLVLELDQVGAPLQPLTVTIDFVRAK